MPINEPNQEKVIQYLNISNIDPEVIVNGIKNFTDNLKADLKEAGFLQEEPEETVVGGNTDQSLNPAQEAVRLLKLAEKALENADFRTAQEYTSLADRYHMLIGNIG